MSVPTPLILVGTGEYYRKILVPTLKLLREEGIALPVLTVDIHPREDGDDIFFASVPHRMRREGEKLSDMLEDMKESNPVVILGHANHLHVRDAEDLVSHGFRVLIEKPFALTSEELSRLQTVIDDESSKVGLIEYYLTMKSAPLFAHTGHLDKESFFFTRGLMRQGIASDALSSINSIGGIVSVTVEVLEGEGLVGRLDHRGEHLISRKKGGGMIHDLGIHAIAPLIPLRDFIGELLPSTMSVRTAHSSEYVKMAEQLFDLEPHEVGESYAEITLTTSKDIPVCVRVGKYVCHGENRRSLTMKGKNGSIVLDLTNPRVTLMRSDGKEESAYSLPKTEEKYYSVLRTSLLELEGQSPYSFSVSKASLNAQALVLQAVTLTEDRGVENLYDSGLNPEEIF